MKREDLISQLRHALYLATLPRDECLIIEFDIADTTFEFEFEESEE